MIRPLLLASLVLLVLPVAAAQSAPLIELTVDGEPLRGRPVAHNQERCWLASPDGALREVPLAEVTRFRKVGNSFRGLTTVEMRAQLRQTWGRQMEIAARGSYVVAAPPGKGAEYADLLDQVSRSFQGYFSRRGFQLPPLDYPLVVLVFPTQAEFLDYCREQEIPASPTLRGCYHTRTNRVALYERDSSVSSLPMFRKEEIAPLPGIWAQADRGKGNVLIHEAIHQLAFNYGLHTRIGHNPRWVVEGLATMLEVEQARSSGPRAGSRINGERLNWFQKVQREGRRPDLAQILTDDEFLFRQRPLDAYSQAWALTYFLAETRSSDYFRYLKRVAARDPLEEDYPPTQRLDDFQAIFGNDLSRLEVQFLRFIERLD